MHTRSANLNQRDMQAIIRKQVVEESSPHGIPHNVTSLTTLSTPACGTSVELEEKKALLSSKESLVVHGKKMRCRSAMSWRQMTQLVTRSAQFSQHTRWPQGIKTRAIVLSMHTLHRLACSRAEVCEEEESTEAAKSSSERPSSLWLGATVDPESLTSLLQLWSRRRAVS